MPSGPTKATCEDCSRTGRRRLEHHDARSGAIDARAGMHHHLGRRQVVDTGPLHPTRAAATIRRTIPYLIRCPPSLPPEPGSGTTDRPNASVNFINPSIQVKWAKFAIRQARLAWTLQEGRRTMPDSYSHPEGRTDNRVRPPSGSSEVYWSACYNTILWQIRQNR